VPLPLPLTPLSPSPSPFNLTLQPTLSLPQVLVGLMLAIAPRLVVPRLGIGRSIFYGTMLFAAGQLATAFASTPASFVLAIFASAVGCACIPALVAIIAEQGGEGERGALLGGLGSLTELCGALGNPLYSQLFAYFISDAAPLKLPGAQFIAAALFLMMACVSSLSFSRTM
jgi:DHA1 family tetracycline resistance protein-like MFS transporter